MPIPIICIIGPTASGKTSRSIAEAKVRNGEIISVDSRQVYRTLDIGTEKITPREMCGIPHHLIDIHEPEDIYSSGDFVKDASRLIKEINARGKTPILAGGSHFYFDALLHGVPVDAPKNQELRERLDTLSDDELFTMVREADPRRASELDPKNRRRIIRALEIIDALGNVPKRKKQDAQENVIYSPEWIIIDPPKEVLRERIDTRLKETLESGLIEEVRHVRNRVGDARLNELGLEYRIIGEYLRDERTRDSLFPTISAKLWQYARHQKSWIRKLKNENSIDN